MKSIEKALKKRQKERFGSFGHPTHDPREDFHIGASHSKISAPSKAHLYHVDPGLKQNLFNTIDLACTIRIKLFLHLGLFQKHTFLAIINILYSEQ